MSGLQEARSAGRATGKQNNFTGVVAFPRISGTDHHARMRKLRREAEARLAQLRANRNFWICCAVLFLLLGVAIAGFGSVELSLIVYLGLGASAGCHAVRRHRAWEQEARSAGRATGKEQTA